MGVVPIFSGWASQLITQFERLWMTKPIRVAEDIFGQMSKRHTCFQT